MPEEVRPGEDAPSVESAIAPRAKTRAANSFFPLCAQHPRRASQTNATCEGRQHPSYVETPPRLPSLPDSSAHRRRERRAATARMSVCLQTTLLQQARRQRLRTTPAAGAG